MIAAHSGRNSALWLCFRSFTFWLFIHSWILHHIFHTGTVLRWSVLVIYFEVYGAKIMNSLLTSRHIGVINWSGYMLLSIVFWAFWLMAASWTMFFLELPWICLRYPHWPQMWYFRSIRTPKVLISLGMSLEKLAISADAYFVCLAHVLSTESSEVMGILLGEVRNASCFVDVMKHVSLHSKSTNITDTVDLYYICLSHVMDRNAVFFVVYTKRYPLQ